jgi:SAM-dependent methyltransferase
MLRRISHHSLRVFNARNIHQIPPQLSTILADSLENQTLIAATLSLNTDKNISKITVRPVSVKKKLHYQISTIRNHQNFDENVLPEETKEKISTLLLQSKNAIFFTNEEDIYVNEANKNVTITRKKATKTPNPNLEHNRKKNYILDESTPLPFLVHLDIMDKSGKVYTKKQDKFRQMNKFLEHVYEILPILPATGKLRIVDFGCGKAYLTFALYHFLHVIHGRDVEFVGVDLKQQVIENCNNIAKELGWAENIKFQVADIKDFDHEGDVDLLITLHACNTATDKALAKGVQWNAKAIISVPCCQQELFPQIKNDALHVMLKHGIIKERFAALATDALRAQLLEAHGYKTQILEFIDTEHTSKNIMIRATKKKVSLQEQASLKEYEQLRDFVGAQLSLEKYLK